MIEAITLENMGTVNKNAVTIYYKNGENDESITLYFSYETIVAIEASSWFMDGERLQVSQNEWSNTTGKLLNELCPDKTKRVPHTKIMEYVNQVFKKIS